ncbi:MAG: GCN5-related N-acetyltransferase [Herbinix sp.]|nr:GCN5-related N-acetyltransferase [Herbinix sp.]
MNNIAIRLEEEKDYRAVEELTRKAFWREERIEKIGVGCTEHYMVHSLRKMDGIMELNFIAEVDGKIVGHIIYSNAYIEKSDHQKIEVLNFGPISVLPAYQKQGVGSALMKHSIECAKKLGYGAILFFGHPTYYPRFGFVEAKEFGITTAWGANYPAFMAMELKQDFLKDIDGKFIEAVIYDEEQHKEKAAEFDKNFYK